MGKRITWVLFVFCLLSVRGLYAQEPFQSMLENTRNSPYNYWGDNNQSQVLPLSDGGYMIKDYITPPLSGPFYLYSTARITRFNSCHNKVWSKSEDSTINSSLRFILRYQYPGDDIDKYPSPYPSSYKYILYGNGVNGSNSVSGGYYGAQNNGIVETTDNCLVTCDLRSEGLYDVPPVVTKLDGSGKQLWSKKLNRPAPPGKIPIYWSLSCISTTNGGCMVVFSGFNSSIFDTLPIPYVNITKLDKNGNIVASKSFHGIAFNSIDYFIQNLLKMPDGGFTMQIGAYPYYSYSNQFVRIDSNCNVVWSKFSQLLYYPNSNYYGSNSGWGNSAATDSKGNIYITGGNDDLDENGSSYIQKIGINGKPIWMKYFNDSIGKEHYCYLENIGISKDDRLAAIINDYNYKPTITGDYFHSYYLKFDSNDSFSFAKMIKNTSTYNDYDGYGSQPLKATADSGFLWLDNNYYGNSLYDKSYLIKLDKNGKGTCLGKDTNVIFYPLSFIMQSEVSYPDSGFKAYDTSVTLKASNFKESIICAPGLFPIADLGGDSVLCSVTTDTLYVGNENIGAKFTWSTGDTTSKIVVTQSGKYWVSMTNGYCTSSDTVNVVFYSKIITGLPKVQGICPHDSVLLQVKDSTIPNFYWLAPNNLTVPGHKIWARDTGKYYLMLSGTVSCPAIDTVHVIYHRLPIPSAGPDTILCHNQTYTMQGAGGITYLWKPAKYLSNDTIPDPKATLPNTQPYTLVVTNTFGCIDSARVLLKVRPPLQVKDSVNNATVCYGQAVLFSAIAHGGDSLHYHFNWLDDSLNNDTLREKLYASGWHRVVLSDNCTPVPASDSVYVTVIQPAKADFSFMPGNPVKANHTVNFQNKSLNAFSYLWTFGVKDSSRATSPTYIYTDSGNYKITLVAYSANGCGNDTAYGYIQVIDGTIAIYIPNAFTPNSDGTNDFFDISGVGIKSYSYDIYNRWGEHIHRSSSASPPGDTEGKWDGSFKGQQVPEGVYLYQLDVIDVDGYHHYLSGGVTLVR